MGNFGMLLFVLLSFLLSVIYRVNGEIPCQNGLFMRNFQMKDAKTWGNVVGTEMQVSSTEILMIFVQGEIPH